MHAWVGGRRSPPLLIDRRHPKQDENGNGGGSGSGGDGGTKGEVRNLGKPVSLAKRYYDEGADEVTFLNITSFRQGVIEDLPMLQVRLLRLRCSRGVVWLCGPSVLACLPACLLACLLNHPIASSRPLPSHDRCWRKPRSRCSSR